MSWCPRFSLREILFVVFFVGLGLASLQTGGWLAGLAICFSCLLTLGFLIVAFVGRDSWRVFSIGLVIPIAVYGLLCAKLGEKELNLYQAKLPSSHMLATAHQTIKKRVWVNAVSGEYVRDFDPVKDQGGAGVGGGGYGGGGGFAGGGGGFAGFPANAEILSEWPESSTFMTLGHVLIALILGYLGGKFAILIRRNQPVPETPESS